MSQEGQKGQARSGRGALPPPGMTSPDLARGEVIMLATPRGTLLVLGKTPWQNQLWCHRVLSKNPSIPCNDADTTTSLLGAGRQQGGSRQSQGFPAPARTWQALLAAAGAGRQAGRRAFGTEEPLPFLGGTALCSAHSSPQDAAFPLPKWGRLAGRLP